MTLPAAVYLRVSSDLQAGADRYGLTTQEHECRAYAGRAGLRVVRVYTDVISGTQESRTGLQELLRDAGAYQAVIVFAVDRLARSVPLAYALLGSLQEAGLTVHSALEGPISLDDDTSALDFGIRAVIADQERRRITRRMYGGILAKVRGGRPARKINAFGFKDNQVDEEQAAVVRWMFERLEVIGVTALRYEMQEKGILSPTGQRMWRQGQIVKMVRNPLYIGRYEFGRKGERVSTPVPAIVTEEQQRRTLAAMQGRKTERRRIGVHADFLQLQGAVRCGECGRVITTSSPRMMGGKLVAYYFCRATLRAEGATCSHRAYYRAEELHTVVQDALQAFLGDVGAIARAVTPAAVPTSQLRHVKQERARLNAQWERFLGALRIGAITPEELAAERSRIEAARAALDVQDRPSPALDVLEWRDRVAAQVQGLTLSQALHLAGITVLVYADGRVMFRIRPGEGGM